MAEQASNLAEQLKALPIEKRPEITLPNITSEVRLTYIGAFVLYSFIFLTIAFIFSHFAIRRINLSIEDFSQQINQIQTGQDLQKFNPSKLNFIFNELNDAFSNISALARQLGQVLNDKSQLEVEAKLLSKLVIKNTRLDNWQDYIQGIFIDIHKTLPFDFISVYLTDNNQPKLIIYWFGETDPAAKLETEKLLTLQFLLTSNTSDPLNKLEITHHDLSLRLRLNSLLVLLLNLLGSSRAISGYTHKLEMAIDLTEQENAMAAEVLYGHLLVKNTDQLAGINYQICSSSRFSGDIIQVKRSPTGSTFILVADATGHGLSATITIMPVISVFNAMVQKGYQLPFILSEMNKHLVRDLPDDRFVAALLIEINPSQQEVSIWNGAMPAALLMNSEGQLIEKFNSKHMALGILDETLFESSPETLPLPQEGQLILYSDGLIEQENPDQKAFGYKKLIHALQHPTKNNALNNLINSVLNFAQLDEPDDDISICQIDFNKITSEPLFSNHKSLLIDGFTTPFEWQMKVYGEKITQQSLAALCNEFMQAQGLSQPIRRCVFTLIHQLVEKVIEANLLINNLNDDNYLQLKLEGRLPEKNSAKTENSNATPYLLVEVSDNATGLSR
ncbi:PP2C family protein-serine/threonine phosphatase [Marinospirillum minutulum]|uniref:PP2C family protein-serine/threonine phosphatase n=1 Tax=Marinospirillum minutulum TaxID=64974 RepID=UPI0004853F09|nr:PP2C family protein-serine/threonine phosphatase [Marinospirillum minutulum]